MIEINLEFGSWKFDTANRLGEPGGFGEVFLGYGGQQEVAIKRLKNEVVAFANRELSMGRFLSRDAFHNVVPVVDYGYDEASSRYYLVMPVCECSLEDYLDEVGKLSWAQAQPIVHQIANGLSEIPEIAHRDLKPANVLLLDGRWKVADFGLAKFVEESTSIETLRSALTPPYAAPEQWRSLAPTRSIDVYALGCIIHRMMNGIPPFGYAEVSVLKEAHLNQVPPSVSGVPKRIETLVTYMLSKTAGARPSLERCISVLAQEADDQSSEAVKRLESAGARLAKRDVAEEGERYAKSGKQEEAALMAKDAFRQMQSLFSQLFERLEGVSEAAERGESQLTLGEAKLSFETPQAVTPLTDVGEQYASVIAECSAKLECSKTDYILSASFIFSADDKVSGYRWHEVWFYSYSAEPKRTPFALSSSSRELHEALNPRCAAALQEQTWRMRDKVALQSKWENVCFRAPSSTRDFGETAIASCLNEV